MRLGITLFVILFMQLSLISVGNATVSSMAQLQKTVEEINKRLPMKVGGMVIEKVRYLPESNTLMMVHRVMDKDMKEIEPYMIDIYQRMNKANFTRQLCQARFTSMKSRAYMLKVESLVLKYEYQDRFKVPMFDFTVTRHDCDETGNGQNDVTLQAPEQKQASVRKQTSQLANTQ